MVFLDLMKIIIIGYFLLCGSASGWSGLPAQRLPLEPARIPVAPASKLPLEPATIVVAPRQELPLEPARIPVASPGPLDLSPGVVGRTPL